MKNKKAHSLDIGKSFLLFLFVILLIGFTLLILMNNVNTSNYGITDTGYGMASIEGNVSSGVVTFFSSVPTWLVFIALAILVMIIGTVIAVVIKFGGSGSGI